MGNAPALKYGWECSSISIATSLTESTIAGVSIVFRTGLVLNEPDELSSTTEIRVVDTVHGLVASIFFAFNTITEEEPRCEQLIQLRSST
mmetsp:Transcript_14158/g.28976  ORF Transcript_14158/g.28976 Transcript_14158/m.28976 type:complete len:90 (-) Transcript_14158:122-391(-)